MRKIWNKLLTRKQRVAARKARRELERNPPPQPVPPPPLIPVDVLVTPNEINDRHGTGVLLMRILADAESILSIRSADHYNGDHRFGNYRYFLPQVDCSRSESFRKVLDVTKKYAPRRILCVPYLPDDLITAIALKELFAVPLCIYVMDDSNIYNHRIPDDLMREALEKADLRLAISPEMRNEYEKKYHLKFWIVPPVVAPDSILSSPQLPSREALDEKTGILVGNIWSNEWLKWLREAVKESGLKLHWFGNSNAPWLQCTKEELASDGIIDCGFLPEKELTLRLKNYPFAVIPSGTLDQKDDRPEIAQLSLPTRLPYLLACSNTPMLVLGSPKTCAAQFVNRLKAGMVIDYSGTSLRCAAEQLCSPEQQVILRRNASEKAKVFSSEALGDWIWRSLDLRRACDDRYESIFPRTHTDVVPYLEGPAPQRIHGKFVPTYHMLQRLKRKGFTPDFVLDIGASTGVWSDAAKSVFPGCRFLLLDPLGEHYKKTDGVFLKENTDFEYVAAAVADVGGEADFQVSPDHYQSTLLRPSDYRHYETITVPVVTVDSLLAERSVGGRGLAKISVQYSEHLVLAGAKKALSQIDALVLELSFARYAPEAKLFDEMCDLLAGLGYRYFDEAGCWRSAMDGTLLQKDVLFLRTDLFPYQTSQ